MNLSKLLKMVMLGIAGIALVAGLAGMALYKTNMSVLGPRRWLGLYILKSISPHQYISLDGTRIYYETYGNGRPVLVLHGGLGSIETMNRQIRALNSQKFWELKLPRRLLFIDFSHLIQPIGL